MPRTSTRNQRSVERTEDGEQDGVGQLRVEAELVDLVVAGDAPAQEGEGGGHLALDLASASVLASRSATQLLAGLGRPRPPDGHDAPSGGRSAGRPRPARAEGSVRRRRRSRSPAGPGSGRRDCEPASGRRRRGRSPSSGMMRASLMRVRPNPLQRLLSGSGHPSRRRAPDSSAGQLQHLLLAASSTSSETGRVNRPTAHEVGERLARGEARARTRGLAACAWCRRRGRRSGSAAARAEKSTWNALRTPRATASKQRPGTGIGGPPGDAECLVQRDDAVAGDVDDPGDRSHGGESQRLDEVFLVHELQPRVEARERSGQRAARSSRSAAVRMPGPMALAKRSTATSTSGRRRENPRTYPSTSTESLPHPARGSARAAVSSVNMRRVARAGAVDRGRRLDHEPAHAGGLLARGEQLHRADDVDLLHGDSSARRGRAWR